MEMIIGTAGYAWKTRVFRRYRQCGATNSSLLGGSRHSLARYAVVDNRQIFNILQQQATKVTIGGGRSQPAMSPDITTLDLPNVANGHLNGVQKVPSSSSMGTDPDDEDLT